MKKVVMWLLAKGVWIAVMIILLCATTLGLMCTMDAVGEDEWIDTMCGICGPIPEGTPEAAWLQYMEGKHRTVFAEGCIGHGFETWMLFVNTGDTPAPTMVTFMTVDSFYTSHRFDVPPRSRRTVNIGKLFPYQLYPELAANPDLSMEVLTDGDSLYVERSMYWGVNKTGGGTVSTGVKSR